MTINLAFPEPPRIPVCGADDRDIKACCLHVQLLNAMFQSAVVETSILYGKAMRAAIERHNENVHVGNARMVERRAFEVDLLAAVEDFQLSLDVLTRDVAGAMRQAMED